jgi:hypothetical protein
MVAQGVRREQWVSSSVVDGRARLTIRMVRAATRVIVGGAVVGVRRLSCLVPRNHRTWVFGSGTGNYTDNAMYLFEHVQRERPDVHATWLSPSRSLARRLHRTGRSVYWRWHPVGIWRALRAGVNVYSGDPSDTNFALTGGAANLNLYHGIPLKTIEFSTETGPSASVYHPITWSERVRAHTVYARKWVAPDYLCVSSRWVDETMGEAFAGLVRRRVRALPPRIAAILGGDESWCPVLEREHELRTELSALCKDVLLYLPTWRRSGGFSPQRALPPMDELETALESANAVLLLKGHAFDNLTCRAGSSVRVLDDKLDATALLTLADVLITDYSSVMFDFALLRRPVILFPYDLDEYLLNETGKFTLPYGDLTPRQITNSQDLLDLITTRSWTELAFSDAIRSLVWDADLLVEPAASHRRIIDSVLGESSGR